MGVGELPPLRASTIPAVRVREFAQPNTERSIDNAPLVSDECLTAKGALRHGPEQEWQLAVRPIRFF
jgi:hypothetical protein